MERYWVNFLDRNFEIVATQQLDFDSDAAACAWAEKHCQDHWWEVWRGLELVRPPETSVLGRAAALRLHMKHLL